MSEQCPTAGVSGEQAAAGGHGHSWGGALPVGISRVRAAGHRSAIFEVRTVNPNKSLASFSKSVCGTRPIYPGPTATAEGINRTSACSRTFDQRRRPVGDMKPG